MQRVCFGRVPRGGAALLLILKLKDSKVIFLGALYTPAKRQQAFYPLFGSAVLLQTTRQRSPPLALLTACKRAVELLGVGTVRVNGDVEVSTPLPPLVEMAASGLLLGTSVVNTAVADEWDDGVALVKSVLVRRDMGIEYCCSCCDEIFFFVMSNFCHVFSP